MNNRVVRSLLFVPAKKKMLDKIVVLESEGVIIDLEDSIEADGKEQALEIVESFLCNLETEKRLYVRINKERAEQELSVLGKIKNLGFVLPKFEADGQYEQYEEILKAHEVIALIESAKGVIDADIIAKCAWVDALAFGAEDFTANVRMKNQRELLVYPKVKIVTCARAYGKCAYDTPCMVYDDVQELKRDVDMTVDLGFDGKLAIHPRQATVINNAYKMEDLDEIRSIIQKYEELGQAVAVIDGKVYEKMHIASLKEKLEKGG